MASFDDAAATADAILSRVAAQIPESDMSPDNETKLHQLLAGLAMQPSMIGPGVLDRNGTLIASAVFDPVPRVSLSDRNTFRVHADTAGSSSQLYISTPMPGLITNEWAIQFSRPLRNAAGELYGVVLLSYRGEPLRQPLREAQDQRPWPRRAHRQGRHRAHPHRSNGVIGYGVTVAAAAAGL